MMSNFERLQHDWLITISYDNSSDGTWRGSYPRASSGEESDDEDQGIEIEGNEIDIPRNRYVQDYKSGDSDHSESGDESENEYPRENSDFFY